MSGKTKKVCLVIGASHAGVNFAFSLRQQGWLGDIILYDSDPTLPYHRPPLSKAYLSDEESLEKHALKSNHSYHEAGIILQLGATVTKIHTDNQLVELTTGSMQAYDYLVLATGARAKLPAIPGIDRAHNLFTLRTALDAHKIREVITAGKNNRVVILGGGYIGLEAAASFKKLGAKVTVLEIQPRVLARVTAPEMSHFFQELHHKNGVEILTNKQVVSIRRINDVNTVICADQSGYEADLILAAVGICVNTELAQQAGLDIEDGIRVDSQARTNDPNIYAIGDCTTHFNPNYSRFIRLESVQNAVDQAKVAAAAICGQDATYDAIPWFWSDQYHVKLQIVGLIEGYSETLLRQETTDIPKFSIWYFKDDTLLAVEAVNNAKAFVLGKKIIRAGTMVDKAKLINPSIDLKMAVESN